MNKVRPLVIVTGAYRRWRFGWWATRFMLWMVGLRGVYLTPVSKEIPPGVKGIIIGGGDDIEPEHYGMTGDAGAKYDPERDNLEMSMVRMAIACDIPILGICRGAQLINVVLGGSLYTDIRLKRRMTPNRNSLFPIKLASLIKGTKINRLINKKAVKVNSLHNQAIDRLAKGLCIAAQDKDDFIQAVESQDKNRCILGVQWHPEYMPYHSAQRRLFHGFAKAVFCSNNTLDCTPVEQAL
ncbi:gamma-glutamyl-gamma-aminobutyrate hydrolase family protein [Marinibactrum halimedae]|uniref:Gamma-glutamyl-gamma-aminobutyrate hydrolase family protein n=1 Tax=Marinibactrum halimedae TaxID=1444977 RepID=A0AA37T1A9_9GAMM|nr:type 1 glutamine amidotransferase [Marinibactrum halimedae]MCD9458176.1 type 1 glutamine amidotransferase [Marinibactrum halimedae]GLS25110.1 hypothetical protein GCM10007877_08240 [Marinibactrum halimedae]